MTFRSGPTTPHDACSRERASFEEQKRFRLSSFIEATAAAAEFIARSEPNLYLDRWLASRDVDVGRAWDIAGPICAHTVALRPRDLFKFPMLEHDLLEYAPEGRRNDVRAVVHIVRDIDDETPIDLVAWQPKQPARIFRYLGEAAMLGASQLGKAALISRANLYPCIGLPSIGSLPAVAA